MVINSVELRDFRNYTHEKFIFDENVNVIVGDNAQGKTNLLEALYYLTGARSFRAKSDSELLRFGGEAFEINADIVSAERAQNLRIVYGGSHRKQIFANGVKLKTSSALAGRLTAVLFSPDDLYLIKEGAYARRRLMDNCISQLRPKYAASLAEFRRVYDGKSRILRDRAEKPSLSDLLEDYNIQLARMSANLIYYRAYFAEQLGYYAGQIQKDFSGGKEELTVKYKTVSTVTDPKAKPSEIFEQIMEHQSSHYRAELDSCQCLTGAHKDDLEIYINGMAAKTFASQGQTRTAALSLKLAEREIHFTDRHEYPVLLLDDVLSELDAQRQNYILNRIRSGQIFITCCEDRQISDATGGKIIRIRKGAKI